MGWYVTLHIIDVPPSVMEGVAAGRPLVVVSLMPHEQKVGAFTLKLRAITVLCYSLDPIDPVILHVNSTHSTH